jgi:hypothetical protein
MRWHGHHQAAVLHALEPDEAIGKLLYLGRFAMHNQNLKTRIVIQMRMACGNNEFMMRVLQIGQLFAYSVRVVVVDEGDCANNSGVRGGGLLGYQPVADKIAKGL